MAQRELITVGGNGIKAEEETSEAGQRRTAAEATSDDQSQQQQRLHEFIAAASLYACCIHRVFQANYERLMEALGRRENAQPNEGGWQWSGFPRLPAALVRYRNLTNYYMAYVLARNLFLVEQLGRLLGAARKPAHCYLIGYFHLHPALSQVGGTLFPICHLTWRLTQAYLGRPYFMPMFLFLVLTDADQARFEGQLALSEAATTKSLPSPLPLQDDPVYLLLRRVLCYKVQYRHRASYRLRPNRTLAAKRLLRKNAARCAIGLSLMHTAIVVVLFAVILTAEFNDKQYLTRYPKCDAQLEAMNDRNELGAWSVSFRWHQLLTIVWDLLENFIIWVDSGHSLIYIWATLFLLNYDAQRHWAALDQRLQQLHLRVRAHYLARRWQAAPPDGEFEVIAIGDQLERAQVAPGYSQWGRRFEWARHRRSEEEEDKSRGELVPFGQAPLELEEAVRDLLAQFSDFFKQIGQIDLFISDTITAGILVWLLGFSTFGRATLNMAARHNSKRDVIIVLFLVESFSFFVVSVVTFALLELHRNCLRSHATLCSLIAYDQSRHKRRFIRLLEFFTVKKRSAYTIFQQYPYTKTTYLSIFGWSISCLFILESLSASSRWR